MFLMLQATSSPARRALAALAAAAAAGVLVALSLEAARRAAAAAIGGRRAAAPLSPRAAAAAASASSCEVSFEALLCVLLRQLNRPFIQPLIHSFSQSVLSQRVKAQAQGPGASSHRAQWRARRQAQVDEQRDSTARKFRVSILHGTIATAAGPAPHVGQASPAARQHLRQGSATPLLLVKQQRAQPIDGGGGTARVVVVTSSLELVQVLLQRGHAAVMGRDRSRIGAGRE